MSEEKKNRNIFQLLISIINGSYFSRTEIVQVLPFILFLVFMTLIYIGNGYYAEGTIRKINRIDSELKELRSEYITTKSDLMYKSKQSEVAKMLMENKSEIKETVVPPKKIARKENE